jgi:hypothetical protein
MEPVHTCGFQRTSQGCLEPRRHRGSRKQTQGASENPPLIGVTHETHSAPADALLPRPYQGSSEDPPLIGVTHETHSAPADALLPRPYQGSSEDPPLIGVTQE